MRGRRSKKIQGPVTEKNKYYLTVSTAAFTKEDVYMVNRHGIRPLLDLLNERNNKWWLLSSLFAQTGNVVESSLSA